LGAPIDRRADLYSLGILLYHLTTGTPPFRGNSNLAILKGHAEATPVPPEDMNPRVPRELSAVILRLMEKKPQDRFQGALEIIEAVNKAFLLSIPFETRETRASYLDAAALVGRETELAVLPSIFLAAAGERLAERAAEERLQMSTLPIASLAEKPVDVSLPPGRMVILRGEKGLGKRNLLEKLKFTVQAHGARFLTIECDVAPKKALEDLVRLIAEVSSFEGAQPRNLDLAPLRAERRVSRKGDGNAAQALHAARETLFRNIALRLLEVSEAEPLVLCMHDIHAAGEDFLGIVRHLVREAADETVPNNHLLIAAEALDRGEVEEGAFQQLCDTPLFRAAVVELKVERLDEGGVSRIIQSAFVGGAFPDAFVARVLDESDGNPETVLQILRFFLERGKITRTHAGWTLSEDYNEEDVPGKVRRELKERISTLPEEARLLAMAFACMGDPCELDLAAQLSGISQRSVARSLARLKKEKILQASAQAELTDSYSFVHSSARAFLYNAVPEADLGAMHERAGMIAEIRGRTRGKDDTRLLAHHYLKARNREKGIVYGLEAARELAKELAPLAAIKLYGQVLALLVPADADLVKTVRGEIADLLLQVGDYKGVLESLGSLPPLEEVQGDGKWEAGAYLEAARAGCRLGRFDQSALLLETASSLVKRQGAGGSQAPVLLAFAELHFYKGELVESLRYCHRLSVMEREVKDATLLSEMYMLLAENHALLNAKDKAAGYCQLALRLIEGQHDTRLLAWSLFCRGKLYLYKHQFSSALKQFQLSLLLRRKTCSLDGEADCLFELGSIEYLLGAPHDAQPLLVDAVSLYERSGSHPKWVAAQSLLGEVLRLVGEHGKCYRAVAGTLRRVGSLDTRRITVRTLLTFAGLCLDKGDLKNAERYLKQCAAKDSRMAGSRAGGVRMSALLADLSLHTGQLGAAIDHAEASVAAARDIGDPALLAQVLMQQSFLSCQIGRSGSARRAVVTALDLSKKHEMPLSEGWAKALEGLALADEGKFDNAETHLSQARVLLDPHASERDLARLRLEHGLLHLKRGQHEEAYLNLEEGLELARRLGLAYMQGRYHFAIGLLELAIQEGRAPKAEQSFLDAERLATGSRYVELLWQIRFHLGTLYERTGRKEEAESRFRESFAGMKEVLRDLPDRYRGSYLKATDGEALAALLEKILKDSPARKDKAGARVSMS
ncbi:MAG TPA: AAA family ATPase, partial [Planctomycetota bacterium]|nr:AAA family ATPase [Planctomycetota bacterium]